MGTFYSVSQSNNRRANADVIAGAGANVVLDRWRKGYFKQLRDIFGLIVMSRSVETARHTNY